MDEQKVKGKNNLTYFMISILFDQLRGHSLVFEVQMSLFKDTIQTDIKKFEHILKAKISITYMTIKKV